MSQHVVTNAQFCQQKLLASTPRPDGRNPLTSMNNDFCQHLFILNPSEQMKCKTNELMFCVAF